MFTGLQHMHSGLRWIVLLLLVFAIFNALTRKNTYEKKDKMIYLFAMVFLHIQLLLGIVMMFLSPKVAYVAGFMKEPLLRFYGMEHALGMLVAVVLVTIGRKKAEKAVDPAKKHKIVSVWYTVALLIILAMIPWPFREALGGEWF